MTIAAPCVVTSNEHGLKTGSRISFESTGSLPTGLSAGTNFYAIYVSADTFNVASSYANALAGTKITTSGSQSGTHTLRNNPWGVADLTHFNIPDLRGVALKGAGTQGFSAWAAAKYAGIIGEYFQDRFQGHWHERIYGPWYPSVGGSSAVVIATKDSPQYGPGGIGGSYSGVKGAITDSTNETPRIGMTTEMQSAGVNYIIRY